MLKRKVSYLSSAEVSTLIFSHAAFFFFLYLSVPVLISPGLNQNPLVLKLKSALGKTSRHWASLLLRAACPLPVACLCIGRVRA